MKATIDCSVYDCKFNLDGRCATGDVHIGGESAKTVDGTCCETFMESNGITDDVSTPAYDGTSIRCDAEHCLFNDHKKCDLSAIEVQTCHCSNNECTCSANTCCDSYQCK